MSILSHNLPNHNHLTVDPKVPADQMLPLMYLIDSICKNHGSPYKEMFNHNLVSNFAYIFQQVSEKVSFLSAF